MRCDGPLHKKSRVGSDEDEEVVGRDMESFEVNYVWVSLSVYRVTDVSLAAAVSSQEKVSEFSRP